MPPSISVVIPCYNAEKTIRRCLTSALEQSEPVSEIVVVDDCSTDQSSAVVESVMAAYKGPIKCRLIVQPKNKGPSAARNLGILAATGEFIALIDSDDFWLPNHIACCFGVFTQLDISSAAVVHQPMLKSEVAGSQDSNITSFLKFRRFSLAYYLFIQKNCSTITLFAPASIVKSCRFPESQKYAEDFRFFIQLFSKVDSRAYIITPRTAVMGKHAWASGQGLSSNRGQMLLGVLKGLIVELTKTPYALLLPALLPWHLAKAARREFIFQLGRQG